MLTDEDIVDTQEWVAALLFDQYEMNEDDATEASKRIVEKVLALLDTTLDEDDNNA